MDDRSQFCMSQISVAMNKETAVWSHTQNTTASQRIQSINWIFYRVEYKNLVWKCYNIRLEYDTETISFFKELIKGCSDLNMLDKAAIAVAGIKKVNWTKSVVT